MPKPEMTEEEKQDIARICRDFRAKADLPASRAAQMLGIPKRTYEGIEQGRGFAYPMLLMLAIQAFHSTPDRA